MKIQKYGMAEYTRQTNSILTDRKGAKQIKTQKHRQKKGTRLSGSKKKYCTSTT
jgi:hypothetical protein